ncbi:hypothetical protein ACQ4WX_00095 [Streptomyces lasalocidi]
MTAEVLRRGAEWLQRSLDGRPAEPARDVRRPRADQAAAGAGRCVRSAACLTVLTTGAVTRCAMAGSAAIRVVRYRYSSRWFAHTTLAYRLVGPVVAAANAISGCPAGAWPVS